MNLDRTLVVIRERSYLEILDLALQVIRHWPKTFLLSALSGIAPFFLFHALSRHSANESTIWDPWRFFVMIFMEAPWATAPLTVVLGARMFGRTASPGEVARTIVGSAPQLIIYHVILRPLLLLTVVFAFLVPSRLGFVSEVILLERGAIGAVARRSSEITGERGGTFFLRCLANWAFGTLFVLAFSMATLSLGSILFAREEAWDITNTDLWAATLFDLAVWLTLAFFTVARFLTYIDQRIRLEGWELELRLRAAGAAIETAAEIVP